MTWLSQSPRRRRILYWVVHFLLVLLVVAVLLFVNIRTRLTEHLFSPFPRLHQIWLPLLFVLSYLAGWLVWGLIRVTSDAPNADDGPEVKAWAAIRASLDRANISLSTTPLFLVLGRPVGGVDPLFASAGAEFAVRERHSRLAVFANSDVVFVVCEGVGVLARFLDTLYPTDVTDVPRLVDVSDEPTASTQAAVPHDGIVSLLPLPGAPVAVGLSADSFEQGRASLGRVARLIARDRLPRCSINGVLWLFPVPVFRKPEHLASVVRADLAALEADLQVDCPMSVLIADCQHLRGFPEFLAGLPESVLGQRLFGRSFPLVPNIPPADRLGMVDSGLRWFSDALVPALVGTRLAEESDPVRAALLWRMTDELNTLRGAVSHAVAAGLLPRPDRPPMLNGIYFAATGVSPAERGFVPAVLAELIQRQNLCAWTEAAVRQERKLTSAVRTGYMIALLLALGVGGFAWWCSG